MIYYERTDISNVSAEFSGAECRMQKNGKMKHLQKHLQVDEKIGGSANYM